MKVKLKKIWSIFSTVLVVLIILAAVLLVGSRIFGYKVFNVISGSMAPTYNVGDMLYVKSVSPLEVKVGDPITFVVDNNLAVVTHRVTEIDTENGRFYTKGDANNTPDESPVLFGNLIGVPQFSIPKLGYVTDFIQNPPGLYITIGICAALFIAVFLPDIIMRIKEKANEPDEDDTYEDESDAT